MIRAPEYFDLYPSINDGFKINSLMQFTQPRFTNYEKWLTKPPLKMVKSNLLLTDLSKAKNVSIDFRNFPTKAMNRLTPEYQSRVKINQDIFRDCDVRSVSIGHLFQNNNLHRFMCSSLRKAQNLTELEIGAFDIERLNLLAKMLRRVQLKKLRIYINEHDLQSVKVKTTLAKIRKYMRHIEVIHITSDYIMANDRLQPFNYADALNLLKGNQQIREMALKPFTDIKTAYQPEIFDSELEDKYDQLTKLDLEYIVSCGSKSGPLDNFHLPKNIQNLLLTLQFAADDELEMTLKIKKLKSLVFKNCPQLETVKLEMKRMATEEVFQDPIFNEVKLFPKSLHCSQLRVLKLSVTSMQVLDLRGIQNFPLLETCSITLNDHVNSVIFPEEKLQTRVLKKLSIKINQPNCTNKQQIERGFLDFMSSNLLYSRDCISAITLEGFSAEGFNLNEFSFSNLQTLKLTACLLTKENLAALCSMASILPIRSLSLSNLTFEECSGKQVFVNRIIREIAESPLGVKLEVLRISKIPIDDHVDIDRKLTLQRMRCIEELSLTNLAWSERGVGKIIENRMPSLKKLDIFGVNYKNPLQLLLLLIDYRHYYPMLETLRIDLDSNLTTKILKIRDDAPKLVNKFLQVYLKHLENRKDVLLKLDKTLTSY